MKTEKKYASVFELNGCPKLGEAFPLALQHVVAMIVGCVTPAIVIAGVAGLNGSDKVIFVQAALFIAAVSTLIQLFPIGGKIGSGLPVIMGVSFAYLPSMQAIAGSFDIATILGAQLIGGIVAVFVGIFVKKLRVLFPPLITGTASILIGMIVGYIVSMFFGMIDFAAVGEAGLFQIPQPLHFGMKFEVSAIVTMVILFVINSVQAIGDFSATSGGGLDREPTDKELSGGIVAYGITNIFGSFFGGLPTATFSQNVGIVATTKVVNRMVLGLAAVIILLAGFMPKFSALLTTIPQCVLGGATISVFASIAMTGIKLVAQQPLSYRNTSIVGLSVALGMGITQCSDALATFPAWVTTVFGKSPVVVTTIVAIALNVILPKEKEK